MGMKKISVKKSFLYSIAMMQSHWREHIYFGGIISIIVSAFFYFRLTILPMLALHISPHFFLIISGITYGVGLIGQCYVYLCATVICWDIYGYGKSSYKRLYNSTIYLKSYVYSILLFGLIILVSLIPFFVLYQIGSMISMPIFGYFLGLIGILSISFIVFCFLRIYFVDLCIIDKRYSAFQSLRTSFMLTKGYFLRLLFFNICYMGILLGTNLLFFCLILWVKNSPFSIHALFTEFTTESYVNVISYFILVLLYPLNAFARIYIYKILVSPAPSPTDNE